MIDARNHHNKSCYPMADRAESLRPKRLVDRHMSANRIRHIGDTSLYCEKSSHLPVEQRHCICTTPQ